MLERFGIRGVSLDNLEQLYNPMHSGFTSLHATRTHLIKNGMTDDLADNLAKRYINRLESAANGHICSIMDFFNSKASAESLNTLLKSSMSDVHFAYQTWEGFRQGLANKHV